MKEARGTLAPFSKATTPFQESPSGSAMTPNLESSINADIRDGSMLSSSESTGGTLQSMSFPRCYGDVFDPSRKVIGIFLPDVLARHRGIKDGPKRLYERLVRWAGQNGQCWYSYASMALELGKSDRQVKADMRTLVTLGLIKIIHRGNGAGGRSSNLYRFVWNQLIDPNYVEGKPLIRHRSETGHGAGTVCFECEIRQTRVHVTSQESRSVIHVSESQKDSDIDQQAQSRKERDTAPAFALMGFEQVQSALEDYLGIQPPNRIVAGLIAAANKEKATYLDVMRVLAELRAGGYHKGAAYGPQTWAWFKISVMDRLRRERAEEESMRQMGAPHWQPGAVEKVHVDLDPTGILGPDEGEEW